MYNLMGQLINIPIASLQTGLPVGHTTGLIINPSNLEIVAFECATTEQIHIRPVLLLKDIRQFAQDCIIVDSSDELCDASDVIRLTNILERKFRLINSLVVSDTGRRIGKVQDYTINLHTMMVQKLYIKPPLVNSLIHGTITIDRSQIVDITDKNIVVKEATVESRSKSTNPLPNSVPGPT